MTINIRDKGWHVIARLPGPEIALARADATLRRVDVWPGKDGAQVGMTWQDGSSCIFDTLQDQLAVRRWFEQHRPTLLGLVRLH